MSFDFTQNFNQDFFSLLGQARVYKLDSALLDKAYHDLQAQVHPDRFAHLSEAERRLSMQWSTLANEAYRTLKNPLQRAVYLLKLEGVDTAHESNTAMPMDFLIEQMEWREGAAEARAEGDHNELEKLLLRLRHQSADIYANVARDIDETKNYPAAADAVRRLMFLEKLEEEVNEALDSLDALDS